MHAQNWLHCDIHPKNVFVHFPLWDFAKGSLDDHKEIFEQQRSLVFVGLGDLGSTQRVSKALKKGPGGGVMYPANDHTDQKWIAPEMKQVAPGGVDEIRNRRSGFCEAVLDPRYQKKTDIYALGYVTQCILDDYFRDMTLDEQTTYNRAAYKRDFALERITPYNSHKQTLRDAIDSMTNDRPGQRREVEYWFNTFSDLMKINPMTCSRPIEYPTARPRAKSNPYKEWLKWKEDPEQKLVFEEAYKALKARGDAV